MPLSSTATTSSVFNPYAWAHFNVDVIKSKMLGEWIRLITVFTRINGTGRVKMQHPQNGGVPITFLYGHEINRIGLLLII